jgi:Ca-activated chloride channel family protein
MVYTGTDLVLPTSEPAVSTVPVRYNNRTADDVGARTQSVAGWYYLALQLAPAATGTGVAPVPIVLDLSVTGSPEDGPRYPSADARPFGGTLPSNAPAPQAAGPGDAASGSVTGPLGWVVTGAAAALVAALVVAPVIRGRRRARSLKR